MFRFKIKYVPGKLNSGPDAASRYPPPDGKHALLAALCVAPTNEDVKSAAGIHESMVASAQVATSSVSSDEFRTISWEVLSAECATDQTSMELVDLITRGFPESKKDVPEALKVFWPMRHELHQLREYRFMSTRCSCRRHCAVRCWTAYTLHTKARSA